MRLTTKTVYALHALAHLAASPGRAVSSTEIGLERGIPGRYLSQVLARLAEAGVVRSKKGPQGGYRLSADPARLSVLDVVEAVEGPERLRGHCPAGHAYTADRLEEELSRVCDRAAARQRKELAAARLSDLIAPEE